MVPKHSISAQILTALQKQKFTSCSQCLLLSVESVHFLFLQIYITTHTDCIVNDYELRSCFIICHPSFCLFCLTFCIYAAVNFCLQICLLIWSHFVIAGFGFFIFIFIYLFFYFKISSPVDQHSFAFLYSFPDVLDYSSVPCIITIIILSVTRKKHSVFNQF